MNFPRRRRRNCWTGRKNKDLLKGEGAFRSNTGKTQFEIRRREKRGFHDEARISSGFFAVCSPSESSGLLFMAFFY